MSAQPIELPARPFSAIPAVEMIDPAAADEMLAHNTDNYRRLRKSHVDTLAADMSAGRWRFTGEAIKFDVEGTLLDGQHRLEAVKVSGATIPFLVIRDLPPETAVVLDSGLKRTTADALAHAGDKNGALLASVARLLLSDGYRTEVRASTAQVVDTVQSDPYLRWIVDTVGLNSRAEYRNLGTPSMRVYAYWRLHQVDKDACAEFFSKLGSLANLDQGSPILALNRRLTVHAGRGRKGTREFLFYVYSAWNAWRAGEERSLVKLAYSGGQLAVPEPK